MSLCPWYGDECKQSHMMETLKHGLDDVNGNNKLVKKKAPYRVIELGHYHPQIGSTKFKALHTLSTLPPIF
jgi:hypothetical protein